MKHKHADLIHAWADGAEIQLFNTTDNEWVDIDQPFWTLGHSYRIKPEEKKPVVRWLWQFKTANGKWTYSGLFHSEEEAKQNEFYQTNFGEKLEWSRTEFPE